MNLLLGKELLHLFGDEFAGVVRVQRANYARRSLLPFAEECVELGDKLPYVHRVVGFLLHEIYGFETRMIIHQNKNPLITAEESGDEFSGHVGVDEPTRV